MPDAADGGPRRQARRCAFTVTVPCMKNHTPDTELRAAKVKVADAGMGIGVLPSGHDKPPRLSIATQ
jgi:hypothetical protein